MNSELKAFALADKYERMETTDIGKFGSGGYGVPKRDQFFKEIKELARLAKIGSAAQR